jgi:hypothetical protein
MVRHRAARRQADTARTRREPAPPTVFPGACFRGGREYIGSRIVSASRAGHLPTLNPVTVADAAVDRDVYLVSSADAALQYATAGATRTPGRAIVVADLRRADGSPLAGVALADVRLLDAAGEPVSALGPLVIGAGGDVVPSGPTQTEAHGGRSRVMFLDVSAGALSFAVDRACLVCRSVFR